MTSTKKTQRKENKPQKSRPDITRIFPNSFGSEPPKNKSKNLSKTAPKKHKTNNTPKNKSSLPKNVSNSGPKKRRTAKRTQKTPNQTHKTQNEKKRTAFPHAKKGKNRHCHPTLCDSTVAGLKSPPSPSWTVLYSVRQEGDRASETRSVTLLMVGQVTGHGSSLKPQKHQ